jgi:hypothetical protein
MPSEYKTYSLNVASVESLKETMRKNDINFRGDADAIHKAIDKYITDFRLRSGAINNPIKPTTEGL